MTHWIRKYGYYWKKKVKTNSWNENHLWRKIQEATRKKLHSLELFDSFPETIKFVPEVSGTPRNTIIQTASPFLAHIKDVLQ